MMDLITALHAQAIEDRLDKLEELVMAMGEVMATKIITYPQVEAEARIASARRLLDELKARRAARKETDDEQRTET